uniref:Uncharacterized protein n=1 Tax=Fagus sylvatica TaxID=28930 RepID=A0A2N9G5K9_FAGSY
MISGNQLDSLSLPHSRTGESMLSEPAPPPLLVGGKCDEGAGLGFLEQTMSPWTAIAADGGSVGSGGNGWRGRSGDRNFGAAKKVLRGLVITMLILLKIIRVRGFRTSRKETRAIANLEQSSEMYREQHGVDESKGGGEGVGLQREYRSSQDTVSFEGKGGDSDTGRDGPKRFEATNCPVETREGSNGVEEEEGECGSAAAGRDEEGGGGEGEGEAEVGGGGGGGGDGGGGGGRGDVEGGGGGRNLRPPLEIEIAKLTKMSVTVATQTSTSVIALHFSGQSSSIKVFLVFVVVSNLLSYLCCITVVLVIHTKPWAARVLGGIGSAAAATGFLLMIAMFLPSYLVWMVGLACTALFVVIHVMIR